MSLIRIENAKKTYGHAQALKGMSIEVQRNEMVAVMGKSGCGKSTLLNIIAGLDVMDEGRYFYNNKPLDYKDAKLMSDYRRSKIGIVLQNFALIDDLSVYDNITLPMHYSGEKKNTIQRKAQTLLAKLDIVNLKNKYPYQLSGGEAQRAAIARALIKDPEILLCDEPTGSLDESNASNITGILAQLNKNGQTIIMVTHDKLTAQKCQRIVLMSDGASITNERVVLR